MSNSRRGLLAAGLAATVVGSMGVIWTLSASAAETPEAPAPETSAAVAAPVAETSEAPYAPYAPEAPEAADTPEASGTPQASEPAAKPEPVPPALLPWGDEPHPIKRARTGASSEAVAAAGADAAPAAKSGSSLPQREDAPKGRSGGSNSLQSTRTTAVPPKPPGFKQAGAPVSTAVFKYATTSQKLRTSGTWATLSVESPTLGAGDFHSLAEIAVQSADLQNAVEVGWNVDRLVNGNDDPHLFVYFWGDTGKPDTEDDPQHCYNTCGFKPLSTATIKPGATLPVGLEKRFGLQHASGVWWVAYNSEYVGYYPDETWAGKSYTEGAKVSWFGEVSSAGEKPCSEMGNGVKAAKDSTAARITSITLKKPESAPATDPAPVPAVNPKPFPDSAAPYYSGFALSNESFSYGGPGGTC